MYFPKARLWRESERGFTLIELLIVMAIIGIMIAIALPSFAGMLNGAKKKADQATAETIKNAVLFYYAEEGEWPIDTKEEFVALNDGEFKENNKHKLASYLEDPTPIPAQYPGGSFSVQIDSSGKVEVKAEDKDGANGGDT